MKTKDEIIAKYGEFELAFTSYYKYSFSYSYKDSGIEIFGQYGGNSDDIYRYDCSPDKKIKVKDFENELMYLSVRENNVEVFNYNNY